jgi:hypothetical protein
MLSSYKSKWLQPVQSHACIVADSKPLQADVHLLAQDTRPLVGYYCYS